ncbi:hypothetical protein [Microvirga makkahensis]|uniref:Uncharacterized protein n=1 Tax=Microvirga makkahensis TaxID=1128670 RepID=A0A7X3SNB6_9HYPH|nr:hypothetical protein [Microvirga makkahensis]MXQ11045.1 hypothetical protein [Microvirga makkahensis]
MARYAFITIFSTLGLLFPGAGVPEGLSLQRVEELSRGALPEVREFITRKLGCAHWEDEDRRHMLRTMEAKRALKHLRCSELKEDEAFLRKTYSRHAASVSALDAVRRTQISASESVQLPVPAKAAVKGAGF